MTTTIKRKSFDPASLITENLYPLNPPSFNSHWANVDIDVSCIEGAIVRQCISMRAGKNVLTFLKSTCLTGTCGLLQKALSFNISCCAYFPPPLRAVNTILH